MRRLVLACAVLLAAAPAAAQPAHVLPPQTVVDILDAPLLPAVSVSPDRQWLLLLQQRSMPTIAEIGRPMLRLAGTRIDPRNNGPHLPSLINGLVLQRVAGGAERRIVTPAGAILPFPRWSPHRKRLPFPVPGGRGVALGGAAAATGPAPPVRAPRRSVSQADRDLEREGRRGSRADDAAARRERAGARRPRGSASVGVAARRACVSGVGRGARRRRPAHQSRPAGSPGAARGSLCRRPGGTGPSRETVRRPAMGRPGPRALDAGRPRPPLDQDVARGHPPGPPGAPNA